MQPASPQASYSPRTVRRSNTLGTCVLIASRGAQSDGSESGSIDCRRTDLTGIGSSAVSILKNVRSRTPFGPSRQRMFRLGPCEVDVRTAGRRRSCMMRVGVWSRGSAISLPPLAWLIAVLMGAHATRNESSDWPPNPSVGTRPSATSSTNATGWLRDQWRVGELSSTTPHRIGRWDGSPTSEGGEPLDTDAADDRRSASAARRPMTKIDVIRADWQPEEWGDKLPQLANRNRQNRPASLRV